MGSKQKLEGDVRIWLNRGLEIILWARDTLRHISYGFVCITSILCRRDLFKPSLTAGLRPSNFIQGYSSLYLDFYLLQYSVLVCKE